jgi:hypothetical protein
MAAHDWGVPPWVVEDGDIEWLWRWEYYTAMIQDKQRRVHNGE